MAAVEGVNEEMLGGGINVKPDKAAVPPRVVTLSSPLEPSPTTASIVVESTTVKF